VKKRELTELKNKETKELMSMVSAKKLELTQVTGKIYAGKEKNLKKAKNLRREIAQMMTIIKYPTSRKAASGKEGEAE
jgi:ribosomal protein L29